MILGWTLVVSSQWGYSGNLGSLAYNSNFPNKIQISITATRCSARVIRVQAIWVSVRVFRVPASGIGFYAQRGYASML